MAIRVNFVPAISALAKFYKNINVKTLNEFLPMFEYASELNDPLAKYELGIIIYDRYIWATEHLFFFKASAKLGFCAAYSRLAYNYMAIAPDGAPYLYKARKYFLKAHNIGKDYQWLLKEMEDIHNGKKPSTSENEQILYLE